MIIWIIGLGGSGKTSLAKRLYKTAKPKTDNLVLLDNPEIRNLFGGSDDKKFTPKIRKKLTNRLQKICQLLDRNKSMQFAPSSVLSKTLEERIGNYFLNITKFF